MKFTAKLFYALAALVALVIILIPYHWVDNYPNTDYWCVGLILQPFYCYENGFVRQFGLFELLSSALLQAATIAGFFAALGHILHRKAAQRAVRWWRYLLLVILFVPACISILLITLPATKLMGTIKFQFSSEAQTASANLKSVPDKLHSMGYSSITDCARGDGTSFEVEYRQRDRDVFYWIEKSASVYDDIQAEPAFEVEAGDDKWALAYRLSRGSFYLSEALKYQDAFGNLPDVQPGRLNAQVRLAADSSVPTSEELCEIVEQELFQ